MIRHAARSRTRSGITLTEILISILIMGVGVISIATLFPLGLLRIRNAQRLTRGAYLIESATSDLVSQDLLNRTNFYNNTTTAPYLQTKVTTAGNQPAYNPWVQDTPSYGGNWDATAPTGGVSRSPFLSGLPVCYDPLWRCVTGSYPDNVNGAGSKVSTFEGRFGVGLKGQLRNTAMAQGLQRLSNFQATLTGAAIPQQTQALPQIIQNNMRVLQTFVSPEDLVLQEKSGDYLDPSSNPTGGKYFKLASPSTIVPALSDSSTASGGANFFYSPNIDWRFTWFATGQQAASTGASFDMDVVICENRPFGIDTISTSSGNVNQVTGETVVEAIWGYSGSPGFVYPSSTLGYGSRSSQRSVVLRWPTSQPDPEVKVGNWIADVTYARDTVTQAGFSTITLPKTTVPNIYPAQRCYWYQVAKKTDVVVDPALANYRQMTVWTTTPLRAQSLLDFSTTPPSPQFVEAALIMPCVVNVYTVPVTVKPIAGY